MTSCNIQQRDQVSSGPLKGKCTPTGECKLPKTPQYRQRYSHIKRKGNRRPGNPMGYDWEIRNMGMWYIRLWESSLLVYSSVSIHILIHQQTVFSSVRFHSKHVREHEQILLQKEHLQLTAKKKEERTLSMYGHVSCKGLLGSCHKAAKQLFTFMTNTCCRRWQQ